MSHLDRIADWVGLAATAGYDGDKLAELCSVSRSQLGRYFVVRFARSPQAWLKELRLWHAARHLAEGTKVRWVAQHLCFADAPQLCHQFKAYFGCTPLTFQLLGAQERAALVAPVLARLGDHGPAPTAPAWHVRAELALCRRPAHSP